MAGRDLFVGIGVDRYNTGLPDLAHPAADIQAVAKIFSGQFEGMPLIDADAVAVGERLKSIAEQADGRSLILMWSGHGTEDASGLRLATCDLPDEVSAVEVVRKGIKAGATQTLFIFDTCQAGAVLSAATMAAQLIQQSPPSGNHVWFGILVSCSSADIGARDDTFGKLLIKLLQKGPDSPDQIRRWSRHNRLILGDDLGQALLEEWAGDERPGFLRQGKSWYLVPNPLFDRDAPEEVVEHLLRAARGGTQEDERSWFTGRTQEVNRVVSWVVGREPGVRVVTGSAGTGKSAIVGRVVCLSNPAERERLEKAGRAGGHNDPGEGSVTAHVHARGLTADRMADALDSQLIQVGTLPLHDVGSRNAAELVGALQRAVQEGAKPPVVVIDGLDEARAQTFVIAEDLIARLAPYASVVVSTRPRQRDDGIQLLDVLNAVEVLDLDDPDMMASGRAAIYDYVVERLTGRSPYMDPALIAEELMRK